MNNYDNQYLDLVEEILAKGITKEEILQMMPEAQEYF